MRILEVRGHPYPSEMYSVVGYEPVNAMVKMICDLEPCALKEDVRGHCRQICDKFVYMPGQKPGSYVKRDRVESSVSSSSGTPRAKRGSRLAPVSPATDNERTTPSRLEGSRGRGLHEPEVAPLIIETDYVYAGLVGLSRPKLLQYALRWDSLLRITTYLSGFLTMNKVCRRKWDLLWVV